jgi:hypothetical protein
MLTCFQTFESPTQLKSVLFGQNHIEYDTLWSLYEDFFKGFVTIDGGHYFKATVT